LNVSTNINGTNAQIDISPTGTGHVHIKPTGVNSIEIAPTSVGKMDNMTIGAITPKSGAFTTLTASTAIGIASGGTGQTTATAAFDALAPSQTSNSGKYLTTNGTTTSWGAISAGAALSNDTTTATNLFPIFADATTGTPTTVYTGNAKLLYKPSTGEFQASVPVALNGIVVNSQTVSASYTIAAGYSAMSAGPVTVASGQAVTVSGGSRWVIS
jgi:hypothetical protein